MNEALATLLRGSNTTISIAHRLSTIKRSDTIICLGNDGRVAEMGSYRELSNRPDGAFSKLMEWQMSGGEATDAPHTNDTAINTAARGPPTETEEIEHSLKDVDEVEEAEHEEEDMQGSKVQETVTVAVEDKGGKK